MKQILVTGSKGQLGSEIMDLINHYPEFQFLFTDVEELDISDHQQVEEFFQNQNIDHCINCAAYTAVDLAEDDREMAMRLNYLAIENLSKVCKIHETLLVHLSTDYVFDGTNHKPYTETDKPSPNSVYGLSKLKGEQAVLDFAGSAIIFRTSWLYSGYGNNFVKTILRLASERNELNVVNDQVGTPTYASDLAKAILDILKSPDRSNGIGIYNYSNEGVISWYDFAKAIVEISGLDCEVLPIESKDYPTKANRPFYSVLNKSKIKSVYNIQIPYWLDSLKKAIKVLQAT